MNEKRSAKELLRCWPAAPESTGYAEMLKELRTPQLRGVAEGLMQMSGLKSYKDLDVWNLAMNLVVSTYRLARFLPDSERYGLISQMQRSSVSIPSNIAEGQARGTVKFGLHFVRIAIGSAAELGTQLEAARRLRFVTSEQTHDVQAELERVQQMLYGMRREHLRRLGIAGATIFLSVMILRL